MENEIYMLPGTVYRFRCVNGRVQRLKMGRWIGYGKYKPEDLLKDPFRRYRCRWDGKEMGFEELLEVLKKMYACHGGIRWITRGRYTLEKAWARCKKPEWMMWLLAELAVNRNNQIEAIQAWELMDEAVCYVKENANLRAIEIKGAQLIRKKFKIKRVEQMMYAKVREMEGMYTLKGRPKKNKNSIAL